MKAKLPTVLILSIFKEPEGFGGLAKHCPHLAKAMSQDFFGGLTSVAWMEAFGLRLH